MPGAPDIIIKVNTVRLARRPFDRAKVSMQSAEVCKNNAETCGTWEFLMFSKGFGGN